MSESVHKRNIIKGCWVEKNGEDGREGERGERGGRGQGNETMRLFSVSLCVGVCVGGIGVSVPSCVLAFLRFILN